MTSLFIFRRDFRIVDNTALIECFKNSDKVIPIFIFTPTQIKDNKFFSSNSFQFLIESLKSIEIKINYYYGENIEILKKFLKETEFDNIYFNMDYTPYAIERDNEIKDFCDKHNKKYYIYEDYLLAPIGTFLKSDGKAYEKFTPFKNNALGTIIRKPDKYDILKQKQKIVILKQNFKIDLDDLNNYYEINPDISVHGGRNHALKILKNIQEFVNYENERNDLNTPTTHLSAFIKYGAVSIREVYYAIYDKFGVKHGLISQLFWREFYFYLAYYYPKVLKGFSLKEQYDKIKWGNNPKIIEAWKEGNTGFPAVDASMREMNKTGYMHNRGRLIASGILIKILNVDWRIGELYFAQKLVDYDPIVNNGNWQWSSGSGADSQPYFRIMSPWKQSIDNDPNALYIKKWVPELESVANKDIFNWGKSWNKYKNVNYPKPIVDYDHMRKEIVEIYKEGLYHT